MRRPRILIALLVLGLTVLLGQTSSIPAQVPSPEENLKSANEKVRIKAARELGRKGDPSSVPALAAVVTDPNPKVRREVVLALAAIRTAESLDPLIAATRDEDFNLRALAIAGMVGYYTGDVPSAGWTGFWRRTWRRAKGRFVEENTRIDPGLRVEPKVISALVEAMNNSLALPVARQAAAGLGVLVADSAVPDLLKAAYSPDEDLALEALNSLAKIKDRSAGPQLISLLDTSNAKVRREAAVTVGILQASEALSKLQLMHQNNPDKLTREKALEGLAYLGSPITTPLFLQAVKGPNKELRTYGAEGLARVGDAQAIPDLEKAARSEKDGNARLAIHFALTALGETKYLDFVVEELGSTIRGEVARSYLTELAQKPGFLPQLYPHLNNPDPSVRRRLCAVLMYTGDATSVEPLERLSHDPNGDVATEALRALRALRLRVTS